MLDSKIDLFRKEWLDVVFDQKNKNYGAYQLRRESSSNTTAALFFTSAAFILLFLSPKIISLIKGGATVDVLPVERVVKILPPPAVNPKVLPPPVEPPRPKENQIKFPPPLVVTDELVHDEQPPQISDLKDANPGSKTVLGADDGAIVITEAAGIGTKNTTAMEDGNQIVDAIVLEVQPTFPGGMEKFYAYLKKTVRYPSMAQDQGIQGKVFLSFIIEKNGDLTDIKVDRTLGGGTDEEAVRVLKASPRWLPGIQNGKAVRVKYNIPISFNLQ